MAGSTTVRRPSSASTRSARPRNPEPPSSVAPPTPSSLDLDARWPRGQRTRTPTAVLARACLTTLVSRLGDDEVRGDLDRPRAAAGRHLPDVDRSGTRAPSSGPAASRPYSVERGREQPAGERAQLARAPPSARARPSSSSAPAPQTSRPRRRAACSSSSDTSRCCTPSCRSRSKRRRAVSSAATMRARDARTSCSWARSSACSRAFSSDSRAALDTASISFGSSCSDGSYESAASGAPSCRSTVVARPPSSATGARPTST